jgi:hypothetical protein
MTRFVVREGANTYGAAIGIIHVPVRIPLIPGDVGNASTFSYPVLYEIAEGCTSARILDMTDRTVDQVVIAAAQRLEKHGVRAITSDCGLMLRFQKVVADSVSVPVMISSLLQLPFACSLIGSDKTLAVIGASSGRLTPELLGEAGMRPDHRVIVAGMEGTIAFRSAILEQTGVLEYEVVEQEVVRSLVGLVEKHPDIGAFLFECADLPPYSRVVRDATGLPVFDFVTMIDFVHFATHQRTYAGEY